MKQGHQVHGAKAAGCDSGPCCDDVAFVAQIVEMTMVTPTVTVTVTVTVALTLTLTLTLALIRILPER